MGKQPQSSLTLPLTVDREWKKPKYIVITERMTVGLFFLLIAFGAAEFAFPGKLNNLGLVAQTQGFDISHLPNASTERCPQAIVIKPVKNAQVWHEQTRQILESEEFRSRAVKWLSEAVQVPYVLCALKFHLHTN